MASVLEAIVSASTADIKHGMNGELRALRSSAQNAVRICLEDKGDFLLWKSNKVHKVDFSTTYDPNVLPMSNAKGPMTNEAQNPN